MEKFGRGTVFFLAFLGAVTLLMAGVANAAILADTEAEFSDVQGTDNWYYGHFQDADDQNFIPFPMDGPYPRFAYQVENASTGQAKWDWFAAEGIPVSHPFTILRKYPNGSNSWHPNDADHNGGEQWVARRWVAEQSGDMQANMTGWVDVSSTNGRAGSDSFRVYVNGELKFLRSMFGFDDIENNDANPIGQVALPGIQAGDTIDFAVDANLFTDNDMARWAITIEDEVTVPVKRPVAFSMRGFSGVQGQDNWYAGYHDVTLNGAYEATPGGTDDFVQFETYYDPNPVPERNYDEQWLIADDPANQSDPWTRLTADWGNPNGPQSGGNEQWAIRRWISDETGEVEINWTMAKKDTDQTSFSENGVTGLLFHNGVEIDSATIPYDADSNGTESFILRTVQPGDFIDLALSSVGKDGTADADEDRTYYSFIINTFPGDVGGLLGDMNVNGLVDFDDIAPFNLGLTNEAAYETAYGQLPVVNGDTDFNGIFDFDDIAGFVALLGGGETVGAVPEPSTVVLLSLGGWGLLLLRGCRSRNG